MAMYVEEVQRFQTAFNNIVDEVDKAYLRKLQANSHECAAVCCKDLKSPTETLRQCVENCSQELLNAQRIVMKEFSRLEDRFGRCVLSCREYIPNSEMEDSAYSESSVRYGGCITRCVDSNIEIIPDLLKSINNAFKKS